MQLVVSVNGLLSLGVFRDANHVVPQQVIVWPRSTAIKTNNLTLAACMIVCVLSQTILAAQPPVQLPKKHREVFRSYCLPCHDSETREGSVDLDSLPFRIDNVEQAEGWQKILNVVNAGEMPPKDAEPIANDAKADFLDDLSQTLLAARKRLADSGGNIVMRRLNRREFGRTLANLTGSLVDTSALPPDRSAGTFDTVGASQFISSDQFEQYLQLGRKAIDEAFERQRVEGLPTRIFRLEPEETVNLQSLASLRQLKETHDRFLRWKAKVDTAASAPENQEIMDAILRENPRLDLTAWPEASAFLFYREASRLVGAPDPKDFGFKDDNDAVFSFQGGYSRKYNYIKHYSELPHSDRGTYLKLTWGIQRIDISPSPNNLPPGKYKMRIRAGVVDDSANHRHFIEIGHPQRVNGVPAGFASLPLSCHQVTGSIQKPSVIEVELNVGLGTPKEFAIQERQPTDGKELRDAYNRDKKENGYGTPPAIWIDWIELEGPFIASDEPSPLQQILVKNETVGGQSDRQRATQILTEFAKVAFRHRMPNLEFIEKLVSLHEVRQAAGDSFDVAIRTPLSVILASPGFLYLNEPGEVGERRRLNDRELAIRLAYFLWSEPPDRELYQLAQQGQLSQREVLDQQVRRMIVDRRCDAFVSGFVHQWLDMQRLDLFQFDARQYRDFDENTRAAAREEVYQTFAHLLRDPIDGRLGNLLDGDFVFINGLMANYYGIEGVRGDRFRKVRLPGDSPRGGLLGMAAIHAMGSDGVVSSPVERGAWVLRYLLNDPPPPAPPNVPQITRLEGEILTSRDRLLAHQQEPQCASCHRKIDPIGFGLENFNATGKWRTQDSYQKKDERGRGVGKRLTWTIDAAGKFHQGEAWSDFYELRKLVATKESDFARGFTEHLISYALGRPFGFTDQPLADAIVDSAEDSQYSISDIIRQLVQSDEFQSK
ncbi:DUF1592 domain-containing protein [Rubripirellula sp.]|nr:DUF1592 domain-containing protein [Rubripirellula sp.]